MMKSLLVLTCLFISCCVSAQPADTLRLTMDQAEQLFIEKNLLLLAQRYQVDAARANEVQQRLFDNPNFSFEGAVHGRNVKWLDMGRNGQKSWSLDQLITLAGKRNKRVLLAREETREAELQFYDLLRTLKYELHQQFYDLAYANELVTQYDEQAQLLQQIINAYDDQATRRNVSLKDAVRLKTEMIQLTTERTNVIRDGIAAGSNLQLFLDTNAVIVPVKLPWPGPARWPDYQSLVDTARKNRSDLLIQNSRLEQQKLHYNLQKAMAVPDLTLGAAYDQQGSYTNHLYSIRAAFDLPFFNRNQGNIKAAKAQVKSAELVQRFAASAVEKEVLAVLQKAKLAEKEYQQSVKTFNSDFPAVNRAVIENFNKGNISILEFLDFFENYNAAIRQLNGLHKQRRLAMEELDFTVGKSLGL